MTLAHYIEFPAFGWHLPISDTLAQFELFGNTITLKWYGLMIAFGFLLAVIYGLRRAPHFGINPDKLIDIALVCTVAGFIGARLYYVFFSSNAQDYLQNPISILYIWEGGLGIYGGIILAFLAGIIMCRVCKTNTLAAFDLASLGFLIGQSVGRWGNFFNQEAFGANTTLPWGMTGDIIRQGLNGANYDTDLPVHPTFLYESLWCLAGLILLHIISNRAYKFRGQIFCSYIMWYGLGRFFIEGLRTDSLMMGTIRISQLVAIVAIIGGGVLAYALYRREQALPKFIADDDAPTLAIVTEEVVQNVTEDAPSAVSAEEDTTIEESAKSAEEENNG